MAKGGGFQRRNTTPAGKPTFTYSRQKHTPGMFDDDRREIATALRQISQGGEAVIHAFVGFLDHVGLLDLAMTMPEWSAYFEIKVETMSPEVAEQLKKGTTGGSV